MLFPIVGNTDIQETALLDWTEARLSDSVPNGWHVTITQQSMTSRDPSLLTLTSPQGEQATFAVEIKRWTREPTGQSADALARRRIVLDRPLVLVTDRTSPPLRHALDQLGIGYVDRSGWISVTNTSPLIVIRVNGVDRPARGPQRAGSVTRLNGASTGMIIAALLGDTPLPVGVRALAEAAQVSPGTVAKVLPTLVDLGCVERGENGEVVRAMKRLLLERWAADYDLVKSNPGSRYYLGPRGLSQLRRLLAGDRGHWLLTGPCAVEAHLAPTSVPVVSPTRLTIYASHPDELAAHLGLHESDAASANVVLAAPRSPKMLRAAAWTKDHLPTVDVGWTLVDTTGAPGRDALLATQLMDQLAVDDESWSSQS